MADKKATLLLQLKDDISQGMARVGSNFDKLADKLRKGGIVFGAIAAGIGFMGNAILQASGKMEQWTIAFETMLGSAGKAQLLMSQIREFALKTPFELTGLVAASKQLLAVGFGAREIIPTLKAVGDVAAGLSIPIDRLILNLGQVRSQQKLTGRELRDFAVAGVPILGELAHNMLGLARDSELGAGKIRDMVSAGKIGFKDVALAFETMSSEGGNFFNNMEKQSKSFLGIISNIKDNIFQMSEGFGNLLLPAAKKVAIVLFNLTTILKNLSIPTKILILSVAGLTFAFTGLLSALSALVLIGPTVSAAFVIMTGPIGLTVAAIVGLSAAILGLTTNFLGMRDVAIRVIDDIKDAYLSPLKAIASLMKGDFKGALKEIERGFSRLGDAVIDTNQIFENAKNKVKELKAEMSTMATDFGPEGKPETEGIDADTQKLMDKAQVQIDSALFTEEQLTEIRTNAMANELIAKGQHNLAIQLLEAQQTKNAKAQADLRGKNFKSSLAFISSAASSGNKTLAAIGKSAAVANATMDTYAAANKALASAPPPFNFALAGLVTAAGLANVAQISGVKLAQGGMIPPTHGGTSAIIGEAGKSEAVIPLEDEATKEKLQDTLGGGDTIVFEIGTLVASDDGLDSLAEKLDERLFNLDRNRGSVRGS